MAKNLTSDLKVYHDGLAPFASGKSDGKDWWTSLLVSSSSHPLKALAIIAVCKIDGGAAFSTCTHTFRVQNF
jgi:hypothetical protein